MSAIIREAGPEDDAFILALNASSEPALGPLDAESWTRLKTLAFRVLVSEAGTERLAFMVLIRPGSPYGSDNYAWFEQRFERHLYIDRVAVSPSAWGRGLGRGLYQYAFALARELGEGRLTAEVNEHPPNPESLAFHRALGFRSLLSRPSVSGKVVAMLERSVEGA